MHMRQMWTLVTLLLLTLTSSLNAAGWRAGTGRSKITPPKKIWMSGYGGRDHPAEGKLTELWAKTLVLEDARKNRGLLITLDLVGISRDVAVPLCEKIEKEHGIARKQIKICTSHTHTGPAVGRNLAPLHYLQVDGKQQQLLDEYAEFLIETIVKATGQAIEGLTECQVGWGSGTCSVAVNRRTNSERVVPQQRAAGKLNGPYDHDVPVLAIRDPKGKLRCVVFGYACHATVLSFYQWSGDYPGFAQIALERMYPGCQAMFWAGCGADQNPLPRRTVALATSYGERLAGAVDRVLLHEMDPVSPTLKTQYAEIPLALAKLPTKQDLEKEADSSNRFVKARAKMLLGQIAGGKPLSPTYKHYPVASWQLGKDVQFVSLGGEVVVDFAVRLKSEHRGTKTWVAGYSHDVMAYIPSRRVLREGGYEGGGAMVYYGLPTVWSPAVEGDIVKEVERQLKR